MKEILFSYNWNNKLDCKCFTSIRLSDKYHVGDEFKIILKKGGIPELKGTAAILETKEFYLDQLNMFVSYLDTGYSVKECRQIIERMYPGILWDVQKLKLILFKYN